MDDYMTASGLIERDKAASSLHSPGNMMRVAGQVAGLALIVAGGCYALTVVAAVLNIVRDPGKMTPLLTSMAKAIGMEDASVPSGQTRIQIGRGIGCVLLISWYQLTAWIALKLISTGGQLITNASAERREFLAAMKQLHHSNTQVGSSAVLK